MIRAMEVDKIKKMLELKKAGWTNTDIAKELKCGRDSVRKYVTLYGDTIGLDCRTTGEKITELWNKGYNSSEIAKALDLSYTCVRTNVVKLGLREAREYHAPSPNAFKRKMPPLQVKPQTDIYYPDREYKVKKVVINGKKYVDVSEV